MTNFGKQSNHKPKPSRVLVGFLAATLLTPAVLMAERYPRRNAIVDAVGRVSPAVVNISLEYEIRKQISPFSEFANPLFEEFFKDFFDPGFGSRYKRTSLGSGVIIDGRRGYILTNAHVVEKTGTVNITLNDEREYRAEIVGVDPDSDLAVLKIKSGDPLPSINMGDSRNLLIGETVIAIGNPFGFSNTVTTGVISATNRSFRTQDRVFHDFIQTDASINPGNSGGPLLNINGELIGINTAIYAGAQGIGFAIPINKARRIIDDLIAHGEVIDAWIGLWVQELDSELTRYFNIPKKQGVLIAGVDRGSPAYEAGLKEGNVLLAIDGRKVVSVQDYRARLRNYGVKDRLELTLWSGGRTRTIRLEAQAFPLAEAPDLAHTLLGLKVEASKTAGVVVAAVRKGGFLARTGVRAGDVIRQVNEFLVREPVDFYRAVIKYRERKSVVLLLQRAAQRYYITVPLSR
ncbi:MAG: trypsin-like peptidase domain-containing protein [Desulfobacterales bacterium]|jgi:Do/DeqQ family serine protease